ncbi:MAG: flagellar motor switch protein FliN [Vampirovibrionales bacterium]|nr:flagellar motor switch protein FliN [Vampirovibrionales bacterium]
MADIAAIQDAMNRFGQALFGTAATNLTLMLNQETSLATVNLDAIDALDSVMGTATEPWGTDTPKMGVPMVMSGDGLNVDGVFWLRNSDAGYLANTMLGQETAADADTALDELQTSAMGEIFSQLMTAAQNSLAAVLGLDSLKSSVANAITYTQEDIRAAAPHLLALPFVQMKAVLKLADGRNVELLLWLSDEDVDTLVKALNTADTGSSASVPPPSPASSADTSAMLSDDDIMAAFANMDSTPTTTPPPASHLGGGAANASVKVQPVQFASFDNQPDMYGENNRNLELVMDVTLNLTVRLGETDLPLKQVLELTRGSVVELNRVAGEPVDLYANGKLIAKGEVVVIEDNFGLRITTIVSPAERLRELAAAH